MQTLFVDGFPARITIMDFRRYHLQSFPKLGDVQHESLIEEAIDTVYTMFHGVGTIWKRHTQDVWFEKTQTCYRLLTAWYIADMYPRFVSGTPVIGGIPLKRKKIGGVDLTFQDTGKTISSEYHDLLGGLESNPFGKMAKLMITTAGARFEVRNRIRV